MKKYPALAITEYDSIPAGIFLTDIMVKESPISLLKSGTISHGRYLTLVGGTTASVQTAIEEADHADNDCIADQIFLPDVHDMLHDAILGVRLNPTSDAIAILETTRVPCSIRAAEMVLKSTPVNLLEIRLADHAMHGKATAIFQGELHDIQAAIEIATGYLQAKQYEHRHFILTSPHEATLRQIADSTAFHDVQNLELKGEL
jgi:microcompartment protein CcmL/EutN